MGKIVSSIFGGGDAGLGEMQQSNRLMQDNIARIERLRVPTIEEQKILLENPELIGLLEAEQLGQSRFEDIKMDPRLQAINMAALEDIAGISEAGGLDAASRLNLEQGLGRVAGAEQARLQQLREDPTLGQGQKLALQANSIQGAGQSGRDVALQTAAQAQQARMAALGQQANLASGMQEQRLGLDIRKANADDLIKQFNAQNRQSVRERNLNAMQNIANMGTATRNQMEVANKGLIPQQFQMELAKASGVTGQQTQMAGNLQQQAGAAQQSQQAQTGALLNLGGTLGAAALMSDINAKTNIEGFSSDEFLGKLKPYKYDYKSEENGKGKQAGVMAQDLEKTEIGKQAVIDTPKGKMVDYSKLGPTMLSSLVELNDRLKKLEGK
jgi:hypothetical protein